MGRTGPSGARSPESGNILGIFWQNEGPSAKCREAKNRCRYWTRPAGLEPATYGLEVRCSIQLSYGRLRRGHMIPRSGGNLTGDLIAPNARAPTVRGPRMLPTGRCRLRQSGLTPPRPHRFLRCRYRGGRTRASPSGHATPSHCSFLSIKPDQQDGGGIVRAGIALRRRHRIPIRDGKARQVQSGGLCSLPYRRMSIQRWPPSHKSE